MMSLSDEFRRQLMETFRIEMDDHLRVLTDGCLALEKNPSSDETDRLIESMFRAAHSLKGAARAVELDDLGLLAHRLEDLFSAIRHGDLSFSSEVGDLCLYTLDFLDQEARRHQEGNSLPAARLRPLLQQLEEAARGREFTIPASPGLMTGGLEPEQPKHADQPPSPPVQKEKIPPSPPEPTPPAPFEAGVAPSEKGSAAKPKPTEPTVRVSVKKLDELMDGMVELLVARMRPIHRLEELASIHSKLNTWETNWRQISGMVNQLRRSNSDDPQIMALINYLLDNEKSVRELKEATGRIAKGMSADTRQLSLLTDEMQLNVHRVRMLPLADLFSRFPRMVRDLARDTGKQVELVLAGQETEVDRQVLEAMKDPLTHLLRNAVDHGIESPPERMALGKPAIGRISINASQQGGMVILEVGDDGSGIDYDLIHQTAKAHGLKINKDEGEQENQEYHDLLFRSGFSTKKQANQLSGRGVGLDVVKSGVEKLQGIVTLDSVPGQGTRFTMMLPLTLATTNTLLLAVKDITVAVPITAVERIYHVPLERIGSVEGRSVVELNGRALPLVSLAGVLELGENEQEVSGKSLLVVVMGLAERRVAFVVDQLRGAQEIVVKNMGVQLKRVPNVEGAAILGSGEVIVVLNVADLMTSARQGVSLRSTPTSQDHVATAPLILVVDDSITTRTLEKNILETAGYQVEVASDGEEAWAQVQRGGFDLVVSDVDMPQVNGFELTERMKKDERYKEVPMVLVTSLDSEDDKLRGLQSGADAYITKSEFDQGNLLETIERLIG